MVKLKKTDSIILDIKFPATKTDMIKTGIEIAHVYDLAHASHPPNGSLLKIMSQFKWLIKL